MKESKVKYHLENENTKEELPSCQFVNAIEQDIKKELDEIKDAINQKQDKVKLSTIIGVLVTFIGWTVSGVWWGSTMTTKLDEVIKQNEAATKDRYYREWALRDFALRDQNIDTLRNRLQRFELELKDIKKDLEKE